MWSTVKILLFIGYLLYAFKFTDEKAREGGIVDAVLSLVVGIVFGYAIFYFLWLRDGNESTSRSSINKTDGQPTNNVDEFTKGDGQFRQPLANDTRAESFYIQGGFEYTNKNFYEAIEAYNKAIELNPNNDIYYYGRGKVLLERGIELEDARNPYLRTMSDERYKYYFTRDLWTKMPSEREIHTPNELAYFNEHGREKFYLKDFYDALEDYNTAIQINASDPRYYNNRGYARYRIKEYKCSIEDYNLAIKLDGEDWRYYNNRANSEFKVQMYKEAFEDLKIAVTLCPNNIHVKKSFELLDKHIRKGTTNSLSPNVDYYGAHRNYTV